MKKEYIAQSLARYKKQNCVRGHMPGHKGQGKGILKSVYPYDVTELSFSDNLANPNGVILQAEEDLATICGSKRSRILTGGATLGVLAMLYAVKNRGSKIIIARNSHKSVFNALRLFNIEPLFLSDVTKGDIPTLNCDDKLLESADNDIIGALLTSPDYYGRALDLKKIKNKLKKNGKLLLIDGAHGAHFVFDNKEFYAGVYADMWVESAHKTLETLTQGALLNVNEESLLPLVEEGLSIFSTSSPSYLVMASVESGYKRYKENKQKNLSNFLSAKDALIKGLLKKGFSILQTDDNLKVTVCLKGKINGYVLGEVLENNKIFAELVGKDHILFMLSYAFSLEQANKIVSALDSVVLNADSQNKEDVFYSLPKRKVSYLQAKNLPYEEVSLKDSLGRICAENAGLFPPCYPLIIAGEVFDNEVIDALLNKNTFGVYNGKVKVCKE